MNIGIINMPIKEYFNKDFNANVNWLNQYDFKQYQADPFGITYNNKLHLLNFRHHDSL